MDNLRRTLPAPEQLYRLLFLPMATVEKFPRRYKFVLGDRIQTVAMGVLEGLIEAAYTRRRGDISQGSTSGSRNSDF